MSTLDFFDDRHDVVYGGRDHILPRSLSADSDIEQSPSPAALRDPAAI